MPTAASRASAPPLLLCPWTTSNGPRRAQIRADGQQGPQIVQADGAAHGNGLVLHVGSCELVEEPLIDAAGRPEHVDFGRPSPRQSLDQVADVPADARRGGFDDVADSRFAIVVLHAHATLPA